jgi:hypothetical protein
MTAARISLGQQIEAIRFAKPAPAPLLEQGL